jgi:replicative DNA helicase
VISELSERGDPFDPVAVLGELRRLGRVRADGYPGGELIAMVEAVPVPASTPYYARQVLEAAVRRQLAQLGTRLYQVGRHARGGPDDMLDLADSVLAEVAQVRHRWEACSAHPAPRSAEHSHPSCLQALPASRAR